MAKCKIVSDLNIEGQDVFYCIVEWVRVWVDRKGNEKVNLHWYFKLNDNKIPEKVQTKHYYPLEVCRKIQKWVNDNEEFPSVETLRVSEYDT